MRDEVTVLFTSAGRRVELMRLFKDAYQRLALPESIVATDIDPLAPALRETTEAHLVPHVTDPSYLGRLLEICRLHHVDVLFPLIDPDIVFLASHKEEIEATGAVVGTPAERHARMAEDKWQTYEMFERLGVTTPKTWLGERTRGSSLPKDMVFPLVVKPRVGSAGRDVFVVADEEDLRFAMRRVPDPMVQEFIEGVEITTDVVCDLAGEILTCVSRQRISVRGGEVMKGVTVDIFDILPMILKITAEMQPRGPITIQSIRSAQGESYFIEVNARFGGGIPLAAAAGADFAMWLLASIAGRGVDRPPLGTYEQGVHVSRFDDAVFLREADLER